MDSKAEEEVRDRTLLNGKHEVAIGGVACQLNEPRALE